MTAVIAESFSTRSLDLQTVLELSRRGDPIGVLSVYLDARPGDGQLAASIDVKNRLAELERRLASESRAEYARAVQDGIARLAGELERLIDPEQAGRGRVLFAAIGDRWVTRVSTQLPVQSRVVLDRTPFIHPLLELLDEGRRAGVVLASRTEARLLEWRLGELIPLEVLSSELVEAPHERSGPVGSRPASRHGTPTGEQRNARERDEAGRFIERAAAAASRLSRERDWERLLVSAGEQLTDSLAGSLPPALQEVVVRDPRVLVRLDVPVLEQIVTERLTAAHDEFERQLVRKVSDDARGAGAAALGLSEVVGALNQARVAHLIYDPFIRYQGSVGHDGSLYADGETAPTSGATADARLTERLVERALETGAQVTPVEGAANDALAEASGIAAVLRW
jgi:Bacterial archaeo-eukaryotic release factor family 10